VSDIVLGEMANKEARYENLVNAYSPWLYHYAYGLSGERTAAEDLVQETFLRAWRFLDSLRDEASAKSWLTTILRRENARKYERKQLQYSDVEMDSISSETIEFDARPEVSALRTALKDLPDILREPLILQVLEGYTLHEIGHMLELPQNTVTSTPLKPPPIMINEVNQRRNSGSRCNSACSSRINTRLRRNNASPSVFNGKA